MVTGFAMALSSKTHLPSHSLTLPSFFFFHCRFKEKVQKMRVKSCATKQWKAVHQPIATSKRFGSTSGSTSTCVFGNPQLVMVSSLTHRIDDHKTEKGWVEEGAKAYIHFVHIAWVIL